MLHFCVVQGTSRSGARGGGAWKKVGPELLCSLQVVVPTGCVCKHRQSRTVQECALLSLKSRRKRPMLPQYPLPLQAL